MSLISFLHVAALRLQWDCGGMTRWPLIRQPDTNGSPVGTTRCYRSMFFMSVGNVPQSVSDSAPKRVVRGVQRWSFNFSFEGVFIDSTALAIILLGFPVIEQVQCVS